MEGNHEEKGKIRKREKKWKREENEKEYIGKTRRGEGER